MITPWRIYFKSLHPLLISQIALIFRYPSRRGRKGCGIGKAPCCLGVRSAPPKDWPPKDWPSLLGLLAALSMNSSLPIMLSPLFAIAFLTEAPSAKSKCPKPLKRPSSPYAAANKHFYGYPVEISFITTPSNRNAAHPHRLRLLHETSTSWAILWKAALCLHPAAEMQHTLLPPKLHKSYRAVHVVPSKSKGKP